MVVTEQFQGEGSRPGHVVRRREVICALLDGISKRSFYSLGLPVKKRGRRFGHIITHHEFLSPKSPAGSLSSKKYVSKVKFSLFRFFSLFLQP